MTATAPDEFGDPAHRDLHQQVSVQGDHNQTYSAGRDLHVHPPAPEPAERIVFGRIPKQAKHFVVRQQAADLQEALRDSQVAAVVTGMRGAGKTQVAAAYARAAVADGLGLVGWVRAETRETLLADLGTLAARVGVADPDGNVERSAHRLRDHLSARTEPALLVLDNATDPDFVDSLLPVGEMTRVVVTSIDRAFGELGQLVDARGGFDRPESVGFLEAATGRADPDGADLVASDLGDLPLALSAAAATITGRRLDYTRYRELLAAQPLPAMLPQNRGSGYLLAADRALLLSVQTAEAPTADPALDAVVTWLLGVLAMLAPDGVDYTFLPDPDGLLAAGVQRCVEGSLLTWSERGDVVAMHRLLARVLRERVQDRASTAEITAAVQLIEPLLFDESVAFERRAEGARLVDHIEAVVGSGLPDDLTRGVRTRLLAFQRWATRQTIVALDFGRAVRLAESAQQDHEHVLGAEHPDTLAARHNLADSYWSSSQLSKAFDAHERNLAARERVLGGDHPDTFVSRNNLAGVLNRLGRLTEAIAHHERNLADRKQHLGAEHPQTMMSRHNLASTYQATGRLTDSIAHHEQNLADRERLLSADHLDTAYSRGKLADAYQSAGRLTEAIALLERNLAERERLLGADHPQTMSSRHSLAFAYQSKGRVGEAIELCQRNVVDRERILGRDHPTTLISQHQLGSAYQAAGRIPEAERLLEQNLADRERILGPDNPQTLTSRQQLARVYQSAKRLDEAIALFERNLADRLRVLSAENPQTMVSRQQLALAYRMDGRLDDAIALFEENLAERERLLEPDHRQILVSRHQLALAYRAARRMPEAIALFERNFADRDRLLGPEHPETLTSRGSLYTAFQSIGRVDDAIDLFERNVAARELRFGTDHPDTMAARHHLAKTYQSAKRFDAAIRLYELNHAQRERIFGIDHPSTAASRGQLLTVYRSAGQLDRWIELRERELAEHERTLGQDHPHTGAARLQLALTRESAAAQAAAQAAARPPRKGDVRTGVVTRLERYGAFVDLGAGTGLVHISELSWERVADPADIVEVGDRVTVEVLGVDGPRIVLSLKAMQENPWYRFARAHPVGQLVAGTVTTLAPYGAFVRVEDIANGLVHKSELAEYFVRTPEQVVSVGDELIVEVLGIEPEQRRISLSLKRANAHYSAEFDPSIYGMPDCYDERGGYLYPEGFDPDTDTWRDGFEQHRAEWESRYAAAEQRHRAHTAQVSKPDHRPAR